MTAPLMPKATAVWLVENTTLTFKQIADFCELHELEIQAIADGDIAYNILGVSPVANGQLSEEEIKRCEADEKAVLVATPLEKNDGFLFGVCSLRKEMQRRRKFFLRLSARRSRMRFYGLSRIVLKLLIRRFASLSGRQSRRLLPSAEELTAIWPICVR